MTQLRKGMWVAASAVVIALAAGAVVVAQRENGPQTAEQAARSPSALLLADIRAYRAEVATLDPQKAATRWFELYDRAAALEKDDDESDFRVIDSSIYGPVGEQSLFASLPPPAAWPELRAIATRKRILPLRYLAEILTADHAAATATLSEIENKDNREDVAAARALLAKLYGNAEERVAAFSAELKAGGEGSNIQVPDLVAMVGEARAAELLVEAVTSPNELGIEVGEATSALARRVALENIDRMQVPQWALASSMQGAPLFEAMTKHDDRMHDWAWRNALTYYFLSAVREGRQAVAEAALIRLAGEGSVSIPHNAVDALQRANLNEPLFRFLDGLLSRRPEIEAWELYIEQAAYTGHAANALALISRQLVRTDLKEAARADFQIRHADALLAADRVADASAEFRALLAKPPVAGDPRLEKRAAAAIKAAGVGRLTGDQEIADLGIRFAQAALQLPRSDDKHEDLSHTRLDLYAELRKQGRGDEALRLALASDDRKPASFADAFARRLGLESDDDQRTLVEIAGIHSSSGQHTQVMALLANSPRWGAADLAELLALVDSQREPIGAIVARALESTGDKVAALRVARATVAALPGNDAGYEMIAALDPDAARTFDELYAGDEYEERPLIWKASVLLAAGSAQEAEATIRRAIAVDPSDGEEGPNDRMRAYAVLAEILRKKGDAKGAALYASAVDAIRLSEHGDEYYARGLYLRAFKTYREALARFSDAYCIQSRLAVQLNRQGRRPEALEHYRRAYELMPSSFGRVESHCFGCESVFQGAEAQSIAEQVFTDIIRRSPERPQAHYLLAYLREQQGRYSEAVQPLRAAVSLDSHYLNAWKRLYDVADKTYVEAGERDIARLKLLELDPLQRHGYYDLEEVGQLSALWAGVERARAVAAKLDAPESGVYPLTASAAVKEAASKGDSSEMQHLERELFSRQRRKTPAMVLYENALIVNARSLAVVGEADYFD